MNRSQYRCTIHIRQIIYWPDVYFVQWEIYITIYAIYIILYTIFIKYILCINLKVKQVITGYRIG